jgi:ATP-binding cassette subfamily B protein
MIDSHHLERLRLLYPVRWKIGVALCFMSVTVVVQLVFPKAIANFIDQVAAGRAYALSGQMAGVALAVVVAQAVASTFRYYYFELSGNLIITRLRRRLFDVLVNQPVAFFDKHHVGELTSRLTADVQSLHQALTFGAASAVQSLCVLVGGVALLLSISPMLSIMLAVLMPANLYFGKLLGVYNRGRAREVQGHLADSGKVAQEYFTNVRLVHAFNQQAGALARYQAATQRLLDVALGSARVLAMFRGVMSVLDLAALVGALIFGGYLIGRGLLSVGDLTAFVIYSSMVTQAASSLSEFWTIWMRTMGSTDRLFDIMREHQPLAEPYSDALPEGKVSLENVTFSYPERPGVTALNDVSVTITAGEKVALVGASGAGKSTIASLVLGHYRPDSGRLLFDGIDAAAMGLANIRSRIAIVEQEPSLFSGSIAENIAFAVPDREVPMTEVMAVARQAHAHEFIAAFPHGYDTQVGEHGVQLSGGQKQRVAIARAMLRDPAILILDEATSALDSSSELLVQQALDVLMEGRTTIIIAHRFSTIAKADRIVVMENGSIVQQGTHERLSRQLDGAYLRLVRDQMYLFKPAVVDQDLRAGLPAPHAADTRVSG